MAPPDHRWWVLSPRSFLGSDLLPPPPPAWVKEGSYSIPGVPSASVVSGEDDTGPNQAGPQVVGAEDNLNV